MELKDFYRYQRPEYFSDSTIETEYALPREILEFQLDQISTDQKQDEFESLVRKLLEKFVCPNLIPQVGPTGGGDGKTDTETHSVSKFVSERWFISDRAWNENEKWAFAISAKKNWVSKLKQDVTNILSTKRDYTKIFFITNQKPSSKKKKDLQDEFKSKQNINIEILDREWLLEKIYGGDSLNIAIDALNLSEGYKQKVKIGARDSERQKQLEEIEIQISNPNRYFEYDFQLVDDALEAAVLSRMLEKSKDEVLGKFDRAIRFCGKINSDKYWLRIYYQRAWTYIHWYDDLENFIEDYKRVKQYIDNESEFKDVELLNNLYTILHVQLKAKPDFSSCIDINEEKNFIHTILDEVIKNPLRPSSSLMARTIKLFDEISTSFSSSEKINAKSESLFSELQNILYSAKNHLDYPFESYVQIIEFLGKAFPDCKKYDDLIESIAEISSERGSEISSALIFLNRGFQKYENGFYKEGIIYFGKSILKLAKEETGNEHYLSLRGLSESFEKMGLLYASYCSQIAATRFAFKDWFNQGTITERILKCVNRLTYLEIQIGRIPNIITWYELLELLAKQINITPNEYFEDVFQFDGLIAIKILNSNKLNQSGSSFISEILKQQQLKISSASILFKFGYSEEAVDCIKDIGILSEFSSPEAFFTSLTNQPAANQLSNEIHLQYVSPIKMKTKVLGCEIDFFLPKKKEIVLKIESLIAYIESFYATSWSHIIPTNEKITINFIEEDNLDKLQIEQEDEYLPNIQIKIGCNCFNLDNGHEEYVEVCAYLMRFFVTSDGLVFVENLYKEEEIHQRTALLLQHFSFSKSLLGEDPKIFLDDWLTKDINEFPIKKEIKITKKEELSPKTKNQYNHSDSFVSSIINIPLWDNAKWKGLAVLEYEDRELNLLLAFENNIAGNKIFENWIKTIGDNDVNNKIKITIIRGIDYKNPFWYRVHIYSEPDEKERTSGKHYIIASRTHTMTPSNSQNINHINYSFNKKKKYKLCPVKIDLNTRSLQNPRLDLGITKYDLKFIDAWTIGIDDIHGVAIFDTDIPIIPTNVENPPILKLLERKKQKKEK